MSQQVQAQSEMQEVIPRQLSGKSISDVLGVEPVLPGEPEQGYRQGLQDLIAELDAKSPLQIYLAEKNRFFSPISRPRNLAIPGATNRTE